MKMRAHQKLCCGLSVLSRRCRWGRKWLGTTRDCRRPGQSGSCGQNQYQKDWTGFYWTGEQRYWLDTAYQSCSCTVSSSFRIIRDTGFTGQCTLFSIKFPEKKPQLIHAFLTHKLQKLYFQVQTFLIKLNDFIPIFICMKTDDTVTH